MITSETIFEFYNVKTDIKIEDINKELLTFKPNLISLEKDLLELKQQINLEVSDETLLSGKYVLVVPFELSIYKFFNIKLTQYNSLKKVELEHLNSIKKLNKQKIDKRIFIFILQRFNTLLYQEIFKNNYKFSDLYFGTIAVACGKNGNNRVINWGESLKNKKTLLKENKIPYNKNDAEIANQQGIKYEGVPWLVYLRNCRLFYQWEVSGNNLIRLPNIKNFNLIPFRGKYSASKAISDYSNTLTEKEMFNKYKVLSNVN